MPTTGEFGSGFGDFEGHEQVATRLAGHFTYSKENKQSQPGTDAPDNTQLRLSDGSIIFTPNLFGPGIAVTDAIYKMSCYRRRNQVSRLCARGGVLPPLAEQFPRVRYIGPSLELRPRIPASGFGDGVAQDSPGLCWRFRNHWQLWTPVGLSSGRELLPVQEQSRPLEHRVSLPVPISSRLHIGSTSRSVAPGPFFIRLSNWLSESSQKMEPEQMPRAQLELS